MTTIAQARAEIMEAFTTAWEAGAASTGVSLFYDGVKHERPLQDGATTRPEPWARASVRILSQPQTTIGERRKFQTEGIVTIQIFAPIGDGHRTGDALAKVALDFFRGYQNQTLGIWFVDIRANEIGEDGPWYNTNVSATVRFEEVA